MTDYPAPSLVLDSNDNPCISYYQRATNYGYLKYAQWTGTNWSIQSVELASPMSSLSLDSKGNPHVSYCTAYGIYMRYAIGAGSRWNIQTVGDKSLGSPSLALDSHDNPHIACAQEFYHGHATFTYGIAYVTENSITVINSLVYSFIGLDILGLIVVMIFFVKAFRRNRKTAKLNQISFPVM